MDSILEELVDNGIIQIDLIPDKTKLMFFNNDSDFFIGLSKPSAQQLINELQLIHDQMID